jgi:hypothetical protein
MRVQAFMGVDVEAIMNDMINNDYTQAEPDTQAEGYDIDAEQLFPPNGMPTQEGMTAAALAATLVGCFLEVKRISQRTASYTTAEDKVLCEAWLEISTDTICGVEQKGFNYWRKVGKLFHKRRKICEKPFQSDRNDLSLSKRWAPSMPSVATSKDHLKRSKKGKLAASCRLTW